MKLVSSLIGGACVALVVSMVGLGACGGDNSVVAGTGGSAMATGGDSFNGGGSAGGTSSTGGGAGSTGGAAAGGCTAPTTVPTNALMTDFSEFTTGTSTPTPTSSLSWGDPKKTLTGGTFTYQQNTSDAPTGTVTSGGLEITASIAAGDYNGIGFYFGPNCGSDACAYTGFSFTILGDMGGTDLDIQMQQVANYPISSNKGACDYADAGISDANKWNYCTNPHIMLSTLLTTGLTTTAQTVQVPWTALTGGNPVSALDCHTLLGIQFQFDCGTTACPVDVTIGDITFYN